MAAVGFATPLGLGIVALGMFYMAFQYREQERFGRFEIFFSMGNLFLLSALFLIYSGLQTGGNSFADTVFPLFAAFLWIYVIACIVMFYRLLRNLMFSLIRYRGKGYIDG